MRSEQVAAGEIKRIVHGARRVILGDIQRREIVEIVLDLGSGTDAESRIAKDLFADSIDNHTPKPGADKTDRQSCGNDAEVRRVVEARDRVACYFEYTHAEQGACHSAYDLLAFQIGVENDSLKRRAVREEGRQQ